MSDQTYTLLHLSEVFGENKQSIRRRIAKLKLKSINRDTREYANQPLKYDYATYLALARDYGLSSSYTQEYEEIELTASDILDLCLEKYPTFQVKEIELEFESESNSYVYTIEGFDGVKNYDIEIDPISGIMLKVEEEISPKTYWAVKKENINKVESIIGEILTEAGENSKLHEWSLENEEGILELAVEIVLENEEISEYEHNFVTKQIIQK